MKRWYQCIITAYDHNDISFAVTTSSAMKVAREFGRGTCNEVVSIYTMTGKPVTEVRWSDELCDYYRCEVRR